MLLGECFGYFGEDVQAYGYATGFELAPSCENEVVAQLVELRHRAARIDAHAVDSDDRDDDGFFAEQNARLALTA
ncbi:erythromycin esterase family protein [Lysobacter tyrosinilyticus]